MMIQISIPGRNSPLELHYLLLDLNGTLAVDGTLIEGVKVRIERLKNVLKIFILTADTFGAGKTIAEDLGVQLFRVENAQDKLNFLNTLNPEHTAAIGNGFNDCLMLANAALSILVLEREGCSVKALNESDILVRSIHDALDLLLNPLRLKATLRE